MATPKKRALLIGINYQGQGAELSGCVNDAADVRAICAALNYDEVCVLYDGRWPGAFDPADARLPGQAVVPTRANILTAVQWLVTGAGPGDVLLCHYSGHGGQLAELVRGSESDGLDETLVPLDYQTAGMIRDDELRRALVEPLRATGASLRVVLDCCHSGTGLDLRHNLSLARDRPLTRDARDEPAASPIASMVAAAVRAELGRWFDVDLVEQHAPRSVLADMFAEWTSDGVRTALSRAAVETRVAPPVAFNVLALSGCADAQTSADASFSGRASGALTHALVAVLRQAIRVPAPAWPAASDLLRELRRRMAQGGFSQVPQLSSEAPIAGGTRFNLA